MDFSIQYRPDSAITPAEDHELRRLLFASFPHEVVLLKRRYVHEPPPHRWLVRTPAGELIAHTAAHDKTISVGGQDVRVAGIAEVCVAGSYRGQGLVRAMLAEAHEWMQREGIPFAMLFGSPRVYTSSGYVVVENPMTATNSVIQTWNPFKGRAMVRPITGLPWPAGKMDLRGPTF